MKKSILELKGVQVLTKNEQITIKGAIYHGQCPLWVCCGGENQPPCHEN